MEFNKKDFIEFAIRCEVLRFGEFVLKSGRVSPYFFNSGLFKSGEKLARLAEFYAAAIRASGIVFDMLYGPAYKGIPLVAAVAVCLSNDFGLDVPYCFNRKEAKDHGEGGHFIGADPGGRVLIIDDVVSAGTSVRESVALLDAAGATAVGLAVSMDRQERGTDERSAIQAVEADLGLKVISLIRLDDLVDYLASDPTRREALDRVRAYRETYGTPG
ncbi:MAG: orotate phosphoribosyltransferase [Gammaproteobacteria bacterium]|nr:orotate phosphoribosyltransferase [Gammaproteobacteria bacterium]